MIGFASSTVFAMIAAVWIPLLVAGLVLLHGGNRRG